MERGPIWFCRKGSGETGFGSLATPSSVEPLAEPLGENRFGGNHGDSDGSGSAPSGLVAAQGGLLAVLVVRTDSYNTKFLSLSL